jgi:ABC-type glycerol-3-phosphate transport system substrate-binding protein
MTSLTCKSEQRPGSTLIDADSAPAFDGARHKNYKERRPATRAANIAHPKRIRRAGGRARPGFGHGRETILAIKAAIAGAVASALVTAAVAKPKTNLLSQWSEGSDAAAIAKLGEMFTAAGGKWEQTSIAGHTANTLAKLRADVVARNAPPSVQLKGPEIAEWNATGKTANLDELATAEGWDKVVAPELLPVMKPTGHWIAAPMNIHRINWIWGSTKAMEQAGIKTLLKTWSEFNADCDKAVAAHLICIAHLPQRSSE